MTLVRLYRDELPLDRAASLIAAEEGSKQDPDALVCALDRLAEGLYIPEQASPFEAVARLNHHLFEVHQFKGDVAQFDAPENSLLNHVLERRKGLPVLLSLIAIEISRRVGVELTAEWAERQGVAPRRTILGGIATITLGANQICHSMLLVDRFCPTSISGSRFAGTDEVSFANAISSRLSLEPLRRRLWRRSKTPLQVIDLVLLCTSPGAAS